MSAGNIFNDLEIDVSSFMDGEKEARLFRDNVLAAAKELNKILDEQSTPASKIEAEARDQYKNNPEFKTQFNDTFKEALEVMYISCEELPLPVVVGLIDNLRKLASDLENTLHDRSKRESLTMTESITDKKLAQHQLKRLREAWEPIRKIFKLMFGLEFPAINARTGNYAGSVTSTPAFYMPGSEDALFNPFAVARLLGIYFDKMTMMDVMEYCEKHPDKVTVKIVNL